MNHSARVRRRPLLLAMAATPLVGTALAGCSSDATGKRVGATGRPDADAGVRWDAVQAEQDLLAAHIATVDRHDGLRDRLAPFAEHHRRHLEAVLEDGPLPFLLRPEIDPSGAGDVFELGLGALPAPDVPEGRNDALATIIEAERAASESHLAGCLLAAAPQLAALLSSIAAAEATHETLLERA